MRTKRTLWVTAACAIVSLLVVGLDARRGQGSAASAPKGAGWAVRASLDVPSRKLYNRAKQKLLDGQQIFGYAINRLDVKLYCEVAPHWDYIWMEMQHSTMSFRDVEEMIGACPRAGIPVIRVPDESEASIQQAVDIGALGINMPTVDTVEKAFATARYARFPPTGRRSVGAGQASSIWGVNGVDYRQTINDNMLVIAQIETPTGVANAYQIAMVPGIDVLLASTGDMGNFTGLPPSDPAYQALITQIHDATLKAGKFLGAVPGTYAKPGPPGVGRSDFADWRFFYNGPSFDGHKPSRPTGYSTWGLKTADLPNKPDTYGK